MTITIQTSGREELALVLGLLKSLGINSLKVQVEPSAAPESLVEGDKSLDPAPLFGIWSAQPRTIEQIRAAAWERTPKL
jgi:hypothetical protein